MATEIQETLGQTLSKHPAGYVFTCADLCRESGVYRQYCRIWLNRLLRHGAGIVIEASRPLGRRVNAPNFIRYKLLAPELVAHYNAPRNTK